MRKLRTIIVDDEQPAIDAIEQIVKDWSMIEVVKTYTDPVKALFELNNIDLVLLDMVMPNKLHGTEFLTQLQTKNTRPKVITISAYPEYAVSGYDYGIVGYVTKPVVSTKLLAAVQRAYDLIVDKTPASLIKVRYDGADVLLRLSEIMYVQGAGNFIEIHTPNKMYLVEGSISDFCERLPENLFARCHRSFIVGLSHIHAFLKGDIIIMNGKTKIEIAMSDTYRETVMKRTDEL